MIFFQQFFFNFLYHNGAAGFSGERSTINMVPEFWTYTKTIIMIAVMVYHMVLLQIEPEFAFKIDMMERVMGHVVKKVAN